jgi:Cu(I)/Ag(I) efflux system periplasmic protein CusF
MKRSLIAAALIVCASPMLAQSQGMKGMDMKDHAAMEATPAAKTDSESHHASGLVKSVDAAKARVTIQHGPVATLTWPAMTMTFKVKEKQTLQGLAAGKKVEFDFVQQGKDYVITEVK